MMCWMFVFLLFFFFVCEASLTCTGKMTFCKKNDEHCYLKCKMSNVTLVRKEDGCSNQNVLYTNTTGNLVRINASRSEEAVYSCCQNQKWNCSSTVIVSYEAEDVSCIWDLKNDTLISCSVGGIPNDNLSDKFDISMAINFFGVRQFDQPCHNVSKFVFSCPILDAYYDSEIDVHITMKVNGDDTFNYEKTFVIIPIAKHKELIIEVGEATSENCTLNLTLPDDRHSYLIYICLSSICHITIEIIYTDIVTNNYFIESHNRTTKDIHVPSITMTNLRPNTFHEIDIRWKMIEGSVWSHVATLNFTTKIGVPKTSPLVVNKAQGKQYVGIYIQKRSEDGYYGPISLVVNKTTNGQDDRRSRRSFPDSQHLNFSETVFVRYNETASENITLQYATAAGISSRNSEVFISPKHEIENVQRLTVTRLNRTHDALTIDSIDGVEKLHFYWCYGEFLEEKELVDCKSIEHVERNDVKKASYVKRPESKVSVTCTSCKLHYGVAIQQLNKSSSILWDSASESLIDRILQTTEGSLLYLYILIVPIIGVGVGCCIKGGYQQVKKVPRPAWPQVDGLGFSDYDYPSFRPLPEASLPSQSNLSVTPNTSDDSDQSDTNKPVTVIPMNTLNSDPYPTQSITYGLDCSTFISTS